MYIVTYMYIQYTHETYAAGPMCSTVSTVDLVAAVYHRGSTVGLSCDHSDPQRIILENSESAASYAGDNLENSRRSCGKNANSTVKSIDKKHFGGAMLKWFLKYSLDSHHCP
jgi:hypothetical protein